MELIAYSRVSTEEQGESGLGLEAQDMAMRHHCNAQGHRIASAFTEARSSVRERPVLEGILDSLDRRDADGLIVAKLDRLARSVVDFGLMLRRAEAFGWTITALDLGVDTTNATGRMVANVLMAVSQWEREIIGERTKAALAAKKARGERLGRAPEVSPFTEYRMLQLSDSGYTFRDIASQLQLERYLPPRGGSWSTSTIARCLKRARARQAEEGA